MFSRRQVNIATITEEDVVGEQVGEGGLVERVSWEEPELRRKKKPEEGDGEQFNRSNSLIEKDVEEDENALSSTLLKSINLSDTTSRSSSPPNFRRTGTKPKRSQSPSITNNASSIDTSKSSLRRTGSKGRPRGGTLNLSGKFVTELILSDPVCVNPSTSIINLGLFIATDQSLGDHSVYKVSPVSPLSPLNIKPGDRLVAINGLSVFGWSHNALIGFVKSLTLSPTATVTTQGRPASHSAEIKVVLEYIRGGRSVRSTDEAPIRRCVEAVIKVKGKRAHVTPLKEVDVRLRHGNSHRVKIGVESQSPLSLRVTLSPSGVSTLQVDQHNDHHDEVCFSVHSFDTPGHMARSTNEDSVVIEAPTGDVVLHATAHGQVSFMEGVTAAIGSITQADSRIFLMQKTDRDNFFRIKNAITGNYLKATATETTLVPEEVAGTAEPIEGTVFQLFSCSH